MDSSVLDQLTKRAAPMSAAAAACDTALDSATEAAEIAERLAVFGPGQALEFAPTENKARAEASIRAKHAALRGEAVFAAEHTARQFELELQPLVLAAKEPPDVATALYQRSGQLGTTLAEATSLAMLDEFRRQRFDRDLGEAQPARVAAEYERALSDPTEQQNASIIRWVEGRHARGWSGRPVENNDLELAAQLRLSKRIGEAREARVPQVLRDLEARVQQVYAKADAAKRAGVRPLRPSNWQAVTR